MHNSLETMLQLIHMTETDRKKKLSWCWQTRATRLEV